MTTETTDHADVHEAILAVIAELPAIAKTDSGPGLQYNYRGVETIKGVLKPLLVKHRLHYSCIDATPTYSDYRVGSGNVWQRVRILERWRVYGPNDTHVDHVVVGEGTDSGDKASNKGMTAGEKYLLIQVFAISDAGADDGDATPSEPGVDRPPGPQIVKATDVQKRVLTAAFADDRVLARAWWDETFTEAVAAAGFHPDAVPNLIDAAIKWKANLLAWVDATVTAPDPDPLASDETPLEAAVPADHPDDPPIPPPDGDEAVEGASAGVDLDALTERAAKLKPTDVRTELANRKIPATGNIGDLRKQLVQVWITEAAQS